MGAEMKQRIARVREEASRRGFVGVLVVGRAADRAGDLLYLTGHMPMLAGHPSRYAVKGRGFGVLYIPTDRHEEPSMAITTPFYQAPKNVTDLEINPNLIAGVTAILERHKVKNDRVGFVGMDVITAMLFAELAASNPTVRFVEADD